MITLRRHGERGHANHGWLDARHSFSFAGYYDPAHMGISVLRVINQDRIAPSAGFPPHDHQDMEIITYILQGALEHRDSNGNHGIIRPGEVQRMSAGSGITHSEFNALGDETTELLQIWIQPDRLDIAPGYEQAAFPLSQRRGQLCLIASGDGREGSLRIQQDAQLYAGLLDTGERIIHRFKEGRCGYLHLARGFMLLNGEALEPGDGAYIRQTPELAFRDGTAAEFLLFDLP